MVRRKTTQEILGESICELAQNKPVDKITIREIVDNCGLSSATFYRHFHDKQELLAWIFNYQVECIFKELYEEKKTWREALHEILSILENDRVFYLNAFKNTEGQNSFFVSTHTRGKIILCDLLEKMQGAKLSEEMIFDVAFYVRGCSFTFHDWFINAEEYSVDQLTEYLCRVMPESLKTILM